MEFTCAHCGKLINCSTKIVDGNFLHTTCEVGFNEAKKNDGLLHEGKSIKWGCDEIGSTCET